MIIITVVPPGQPSPNVWPDPPPRPRPKPRPLRLTGGQRKDNNPVGDVRGGRYDA